MASPPLRPCLGGRRRSKSHAGQDLCAISVQASQLREVGRRTCPRSQAESGWHRCGTSRLCTPDAVNPAGLSVLSPARPMTFAHNRRKVKPMPLVPDEPHTLREIEHHLTIEDPTFVAYLAGRVSCRRPRPRIVALYLVAPLLIGLGVGGQQLALTLVGLLLAPVTPVLSWWALRSPGRAVRWRRDRHLSPTAVLARRRQPSRQRRRRGACGGWDGDDTDPTAAGWARPDGIVERTRWLFAVLVLVSLALTAPVPLATANAATLALTAAATVTLAVSCGYSYRARRAARGVDLVDAVAILALALACPVPGGVFGFVFALLWFRSLYSTPARGLVRGTLFAVAVVAVLPLWRFIPGHAPAIPASRVLVALPFMFVTIVVGQQLASGLFAREQASRRDAALTALGSRLLGVTDAEVIRRWAVWAADEICAATPGLRMLRVVRDGPVLRVTATAGPLATIPATVQVEILDSGADRSHSGQFGDTGPLNAAAGTSCAWTCIGLPEQGRVGWLVVGAPKKILSEADLAVRSLVNQVALALHNSQVHGELAVQARTDPLTGLANRAAFTTAVSDTLSGPAAAASAVLFLDLDDFKYVNDALGHRIGDRLLREVAARLLRVTRPDALCARLGGDEFAVLLTQTTDGGAVEVAQRLVETMAAPARIDQHTLDISASVGVASPTADQDVEHLVAAADVAMYAAKANGKARMQVFHPGLLHGHADDLERQLAAASAAGQLDVYYQPLLALPEGHCVGVEALVRWQHPDRGLLHPGQFIEAAERNGVIVDVGAFVLRRACADAAGWRAAFPDNPLAVHVNVSARQLDHEDFLDLVRKCLAEFALPAVQLVLEITETVVLDAPGAIERLRALADHGVTIALDDFGTGYSALTTLRTLPVDIVKIDKSFVAGVPHSPADQAVIEAIVQMASRLRLQTVAEGVERPDQQRFLQAAGTDNVQGYSYLRPVPANQFSTWLQQHIATRPDEQAPGHGVTPLPILRRPA